MFFNHWIEKILVKSRKRKMEHFKKGYAYKEMPVVKRTKGLIMGVDTYRYV